MNSSSRNKNNKVTYREEKLNASKTIRQFYNTSITDLLSKKLITIKIKTLFI